jgi:hypothetical protein
MGNKVGQNLGKESSRNVAKIGDRRVEEASNQQQVALTCQAHKQTMSGQQSSARPTVHVAKPNAGDKEGSLRQPPRNVHWKKFRSDCVHFVSYSIKLRSISQAFSTLSESHLCGRQSF